MVYSKNLEYQKTFAEFFAGIGLMRIGLEEAGWQISFANDIDPMKQRLYSAHFQDSYNHFALGDIHELDIKDIPPSTLATASFPCTDLSLAGRREGLAGKHSSAFWGFIDILKKMEGQRPPIVLLENVAGFLTSHKGKDFEEALKALNSLGYSVDAFVVDAANFVPQSRVRLFIIGHTNGSSESVSSAEDNQLSLFYEGELRPKKLVDFFIAHPEINWSIRELPKLPKNSILLHNVVDNTKDDSSEWWSQERVDYLLNQTSEKHRLIIETLQSKNQYSYLTAFRRVRNGRSMAEIRGDGIAGCLRTPKGGSARQILLKVGIGEVKVRFISPRECAKLMGANEFIITGSTTDALFGFGDAVCVPVISWIGKNYLNPLLAEINEKINRKKAYVKQQASSGIS
ncbi:MAG: DNA cytosine methyltransferase [Lewinellaceae bacterium]|nr:DNA cytosine methyltransferase [Lewinellaceae bacterium]